jgi:hypothetical protein
MNPHSPRLSSAAKLSRARLIIILLLPLALVVAATVARRGQKQLAPPQPLGVPVQSALPKVQLDMPLAELIKERPSLNLLQTLTRHSPEDDLLALFPRPQAQEEFEGDVEERRNWFLFQRQFPFNEIPEEARLKAWESRPIAKPELDPWGEKLRVCPGSLSVRRRRIHFFQVVGERRAVASTPSPFRRPIPTSC